MGIHFISFFIMAFPFLSFSFRFLFSYRLSSSFLEELLHQRPAFLFEYSSDGCRFGMKYVGGESAVTTLFIGCSVYDAWYLCPSDGSGTHGTRFHGDVERAVGEIFASQGISPQMHRHYGRSGRRMQRVDDAVLQEQKIIIGGYGVLAIA